MIVGSAVATMLLSTAGMKVAINAATRTSPRCATVTDGRNSGATVWSKRFPLPLS
jgi:dihydroxyacid dehydratase/phosphogluconate dehydratase